MSREVLLKIKDLVDSLLKELPSPEVEAGKKQEKLRFNITWMKGMSSDFKKTYLKSLDIATTVANSVEFKDKVLAFPFKETDGMNSQQIYERFMNGQMSSDETVDHSIDTGVNVVYDPNGPYGYSYLGDDEYTLNSYLLFKEDEIVNNLVHEYQHLEGFTHEVAWDYSVPYGMGNIAGELARRVMQNKKPLTPLPEGLAADVKKVKFVDSRFSEGDVKKLVG